jgi:hypothetical protein
MLAEVASKELARARAVSAGVRHVCETKPSARAPSAARGREAPNTEKKNPCHAPSPPANAKITQPRVTPPDHIVGQLSAACGGQNDQRKKNLLAKPTGTRSAPASPHGSLVFRAAPHLNNRNEAMRRRETHVSRVLLRVSCGIRWAVTLRWGQCATQTSAGIAKPRETGVLAAEATSGAGCDGCQPLEIGARPHGAREVA